MQEGQQNNDDKQGDESGYHWRIRNRARPNCTVP
jgi:hypothetical protein